MTNAMDKNMKNVVAFVFLLAINARKEIAKFSEDSSTNHVLVEGINMPTAPTM
jgi:hypothetical protein